MRCLVITTRTPAVIELYLLRNEENCYLFKFDKLKLCYTLFSMFVLKFMSFNRILQKCIISGKVIKAKARARASARAVDAQSRDTMEVSKIYDGSRYFTRPRFVCSSNSASCIYPARPLTLCNALSRFHVL